MDKAMDFKACDQEPSELQESKDLLKLNLNLDKNKYLLKIFPSKDNISIIFKLEIEKIQTFYYYAKLNINDFQKINKKFISDKTIFNVFLRLKDLTQNYLCSIKKLSLKINILFKKKNSEFSPIFTLRKKIVNQNKLNSDLVSNINENKIKIKLLKKQITKLEKSIQNKNSQIIKINNTVENLKNNTDNINIKNIESNDLDNTKPKNDNKNNNKNNGTNTLTKKEETDDLIKKLYTISEQENKLLKQNLSLNEYDKDEQELETNNFVSNNKKKNNKNRNKQLKFILQKEKEENIMSENNPNEALFCFENIDVLKNRKIYETLVIFNILTILIIIYLVCTIYSLKKSPAYERIKALEFMKRLSFFSLLSDNEDNDVGQMRENIVDFQLKNNGENNNNTNRTKVNHNSKKRIEELKNISLLTEEKEKRYFKKHIRRRIRNRIKDLSFDLKYNSKEARRFKSFYNNNNNINEMLILIKTKKGKKIGLFIHNFFLFSNDLENENENDYIGFVYNNDQINEMNLEDFFYKYGTYLQNIYNFLISERLRINNKYNVSTKEFNKNIDIFEIYQVKYIR